MQVREQQQRDRERAATAAAAAAGEGEEAASGWQQILRLDPIAQKLRRSKLARMAFRRLVCGAAAQQRHWRCAWCMRLGSLHM